MGCRESYQPNATVHNSENASATTSSKSVIVVYGMTQSMATQRVLATLLEKGLNFELKVVNLATGEHKVPSYLEKQPFGSIPVLVDVDGFTIYESRAICRYLEKQYKGRGTELIPSRNSKDDGLFEQGASIEVSNFDPYASGLVGEKVHKKLRGGEPDMAKVAAFKKELGDHLDVYEHILSKQPYIGGQTFTLADLFHLPYGAMVVKAGDGEVFESRPHVKQWWNKISERPAWQSVLDMK